MVADLIFTKTGCAKKGCFNAMELPIVRNTFFEVSMTLREEILVITFVLNITSNF